MAIIGFALEIWKNRADPVQAKLRAAAQITKDLNDDKESFDKALKNGDAIDLSGHFEQLRNRVRTSTGGSGSASGQGN